MADHEEYKIRKYNLETNPYLRNFKEGFWKSPSGKVVECVASHEAEMVNLRWNNKFHTSIYPVVWDSMFEEWTYLGR